MRKIILAIVAMGHQAGNGLAAFWCFVILTVRPSRRSYYGQQFLYRTEGGTFERAFAAFGQTAAGPGLLKALPDSIAMLRDRAYLRHFPKNTLGRHYCDFMVRSDIDEDLYLAGAVEAGLRFERDPHRRWFRTRVEAGHDLRHVITEYGIDPLGETCLMAFRFGQTRHAGACLIATLGFLVLAFRRQAGLVQSMREAYRRGRAALLLDLLPWEELLETPLATVQRMARLETPQSYAASSRSKKAVRPVVEAMA